MSFKNNLPSNKLAFNLISKQMEGRLLNYLILFKDFVLLRMKLLSPIITSVMETMDFGGQQHTVQVSSLEVRN